MKWGRKKPLFPMSWLSTFKKMSGTSSSPKPANKEKRDKRYPPSPCSPFHASCNDEKNRNGGLKSVLKDREEAEFTTLRRASKYEESRKGNPRALKQTHYTRSEIQGMLERINQTERKYMKEEASLDWQELKDVKIKEIKLKSVNTKQSGKTRAYSPRTECKIRAIEDMKKAKKKMKQVEKQREGNKKPTAFDSFAVVKSSVDPQRDFRDSMVEMIMEKGIRRPEELEELLACYLTLNWDEYHDLIIKVFRQVWFDLDQVHFRPPLRFQNCCSD